MKGQVVLVMHVTLFMLSHAVTRAALCELLRAATDQMPRMVLGVIVHSMQGSVFVVSK